MKSGAIFSANKKHRYVLYRIWNNKKPIVCFVGLNPSTAGGKDEDHTTTKLKKFCEYQGYGGYYLVNLFSRIATDFDDLKAMVKELDADTHLMKYHELPIPYLGLNTEYSLKNFERWTKAADIIIPMWGGKGVYLQRDKEVITKLYFANKPIYVFGLTRKGNPVHPLMLAYSTTFKRSYLDLYDKTFFFHE